MGFKAMREKAGLRAVDVAQEIGVTKQAVSLWENGKNFPRGKILKELAILYGCDIDSLMSGNPNPDEKAPVEEEEADIDEHKERADIS